MEEPWNMRLKKEVKKHLPGVIFSISIAIFIAILSHMTPLFMRTLLNEYCLISSIRLLWQTVFLMCLIPLITFWVKRRYSEWLITEVNDRAGVLRQVIFIGLLSEPLTFYERASPNKTYEKYGSDAENFMKLLIGEIPSFVAKAFTIALVFVIMALLSPSIALVQLIFIFILFLIKSRKKRCFEKEFGKINYIIESTVEETFKYIGVIKVYALENLRVKILAEALRERKGLLVPKVLEDENSSTLFCATTGAFFCLSFGLGLKSLMNGTMLIGDLLLVMIYLPLMYILLSEIWDLWPFRLKQFSSLFEFLVEPVGIVKDESKSPFLGEQEESSGA